MTAKFHADPGARRRFGRYYTPPPMVGALHRLLAEGLRADALDPGRCALIDPSCGPGAFLEPAEALHYRERLGLDLDQEALQEAARAAPGARLVHGDAYQGGLEAMSSLLRGHGPVAVVGNPPYVANSELLKSGRYHEIRDRLLPFSREVAKGTSVRDDYVLFFGVADQLIEAGGGEGAIAFVTSDSFVDNFLYLPLRRWLLSRYRLHTLVECGPNLFEGARVSTALSVWVRSHQAPDDRTAFQHARLSGTPHQRIAQLASDLPFTRSTPHGASLLLTAPSVRDSALARRMKARGDPISSVVTVSLPGLKTRFDELLVAPDSATLEARLRDFFTAPTLEDFLTRHAFPARTLDKLRVAFESREETSFSLEAIRPFARYAGVKHRFCVPPSALAFAYVDRVLIPRGDHRFRGEYDPHRVGPKLVFNVREVPLSAAVVMGPTCVTAYQHARFAPLKVPFAIAAGGLAAASQGSLGPGVLNLSPAWKTMAALLEEPADLFHYVCAIVNSRLVQERFAPLCGASEEIPIARFDGTQLAVVKELVAIARKAKSGALLGARGDELVELLYR